MSATSAGVREIGTPVPYDHAMSVVAVVNDRSWISVLKWAWTPPRVRSSSITTRMASSVALRVASGGAVMRSLSRRFLRTFRLSWSALTRRAEFRFVVAFAMAVPIQEER